MTRPEVASIAVLTGPMMEIEVIVDSFEQSTFTIPTRGQVDANSLRQLSTFSVTDHQFSSTEVVSNTAPSLSLDGRLNVVYDDNLSFDYELTLTQAPWLDNGIEGSLSVLQGNGSTLLITSNDRLNEHDPTTSFEAVFRSVDGDVQSYNFPTEGLYIPWGSNPALQ